MITEASFKMVEYLLSAALRDIETKLMGHSVPSAIRECLSMVGGITCLTGNAQGALQTEVVPWQS